MAANLETYDPKDVYTSSGTRTRIESFTPMDAPNLLVPTYEADVVINLPHAPSTNRMSNVEKNGSCTKENVASSPIITYWTEDDGDVNLSTRVDENNVNTS